MPVSLRDLRHSRHLTLSDLALLTGLTPAQLSRVETGKRHLSPRSRIAIVRALELPLTSARGVRELSPGEDRLTPRPPVSPVSPSPEAASSSEGLPA